MAEITTVIFDMYETLVQNPTDTWKTSFAKISAEQNLGVTADQIWEHWTLADEEFRNSRIDPSLPFRSYYDGWRGGFQRAFDALKVVGDSAAATDSFFADLGQRSGLIRSGGAGSQHLPFRHLFHRPSQRLLERKRGPRAAPRRRYELTRTA